VNNKAKPWYVMYVFSPFILIAITCIQSEPIELVESESINADEEIVDSGDVKELKEEHKTLIACVTAIVVISHE
jgi:hypothetical protein